jgi:hypothetical protein
MNTKLIALPERAIEMAGKWGGDVMEMVPRASKWLETGAKIGVLKTGSRVAVTFVRRHPIATAATVVGAGALWLLARNAKKRLENGDGREPIEGSARRVEAKRAGTTTRRAPRKTTARKRTPAAE